MCDVLDRATVSLQMNRCCIARATSSTCAFALLMAIAGCGYPLSQSQAGIQMGGRAVSVAVDPTNADHIVVASEGGGLFRSVDRGVNWS
jgi:hypothetical protein